MTRLSQNTLGKMLLLKFYGLNRGLFFSSCLDMLFNDYFVNCVVTTHSFYHRIVLFFISCHSKRNIPGHNLPHFCRKISFSFLFSVVYNIYFFPVLFLFIAHIKYPVLRCQFAYVLVCGQMFMSSSSYFSCL